MTLDELLLTYDAINKRTKETFKFQASLQGVDLNMDDEPEDLGDDGLPEELLRAERELKKRREENAEHDEFGKMGLGYSTE